MIIQYDEIDNKFIELFEKLNKDKKIKFYENLIHELTILIRRCWSDNRLSNFEKIDQIKWINEIIHGIPIELNKLRNDNSKIVNNFFEDTLIHFSKLNSNISNHIYGAVR